MVLSSEAFAAQVTGIGTLIRMCPLVDQQIIRLGKMAATVAAYELLPVPVGEKKRKQGVLNKL